MGADVLVVEPAVENVRLRIQQSAFTQIFATGGSRAMGNANSREDEHEDKAGYTQRGRVNSVPAPTFRTIPDRYETIGKPCCALFVSKDWLSTATVRLNS